MQRDLPSERRIAVRKQVKIPIKYQVDSVVHGVLTHDVSSGGICFIANHFLAKAARIPLTLAFEFLDYPLQVMTHVAWVASMPYSDQYKIGIEFRDMSPFYKSRITDYINLQ